MMVMMMMVVIITTVSGRHHDDAGLIISVISAIIAVVVVMMMVVMVILSELQQRFRLVCLGQVIRDERRQGIRNRLQEVGIGLNRGGGGWGRRRAGAIEGQKAGGTA